MWERKPQTFANHTRWVPPYHFVIPLILLVYLALTVWSLIRRPGLYTLVDFLFLLSVAGIFYYSRDFALRVQDRVIRLEMRLRLAEILPEDLRGRIPELRPRQLVALRFASDGELPDLVRQVLDEGLTDRTEIKRRIKSWQPDYLRC